MGILFRPDRARLPKIPMAYPDRGPVRPPAPVHEPGAAHPLSTAVCALDHGTRLAINQAISRLGVPAREVPLPELAEAGATAEVVCLDSAAFAAGGTPRPPVVVVTRGAPFPDATWATLLQVRPVVVSASGLTAGGLLEAMLRAKFQVESATLPDELARLPRAFVTAFLTGPDRFGTLCGAASALGISCRVARILFRDLGFQRFDRLVTVLRAETWGWLAGAKVNRQAVEAYLGINDRSNFRRACRRASVAAPWLARSGQDDVTNGPPNDTNGP